MKLAIIIFLFNCRNLINFCNSISCYDCRANDNTCNIGECEGASCIKMETSNIDNGRKTVYKSCINEYEETQCKQSGFGSKLIARCVCDTNFCNGDKNLEAAGLERNSNIAYQTKHEIIYIFILSIFLHNFFL